MKKSAFVLYLEYEEILEDLTDAEIGLLFRAILKYERTQELPTLPLQIMIPFKFVKKDLDNNRAKWQSEVKKRSEAGKKGMQTRWGGVKNGNTGNSDDEKLPQGDNNDMKPLTRNNTVIDGITNITDNVHSYDQSCDNDHSLSLRAPTLAEVLEYGKAREIDEKFATQFFYHYNGLDWLDKNGKQITSWKHLLATWWTRRDTTNANVTTKKQPRHLDFKSHNYTEAELNDWREKLLNNANDF